ncbi:MAG: leukotoxin LktA family filamentous adhesin, partial [Acidaminococcaceae bacterium]|nr:leukotoxin LktA family filamentous adhesin [Acidaminococcaceae bacterium]
MTYGYYGAKGSRKQSKTKTLEVRRILASLAMTAGLLVYPFSVGEAATEIVRKEGVTGPQITHPENNNNVYNIDPEGSSGNFAYNRFEKFNLDSGHIANLNFKEAAALANLVNNQVSINGIVNAVKNGKIDGHLLFLSPNGIAVGASGVINAGQFTGIVPTQTAFDKLYNSSNPATDITLDTVQNLNAYANDKAIDISGKINTHSGVMLGAGIININDGAKIQSTKNLDFKDLVNIQNGANADLGELTKVEGSGGEIVLAAKQVSDVKDTKVTKDENGQDKTEANAIRWKDR